MKTSFDICVIGGGVIGLTLARSLVARGADVAVIDANSEIAPATAAAAGMLAPSFEKGSGALGEALYQISTESLTMWPDYAAALEDLSGVNIDFRADGILGVALNEGEVARLSGDRDRLAALGASVEMLDHTSLRAFEPALSETAQAGMFASQDAQVDPRKLVRALQTAVRCQGGTVIAAKVTAVLGDIGARNLRLANGHYLSSSKIVIASGAAPANLIDDLQSPPVFPVKGEALAVNASLSAPKRVIRAAGAYLCPKADGRLIIGATEKPHLSDLAVDANEIVELRRAAAAVVPAAPSWPELERWAGLRPATPDGAPVLGSYLSGPEDIFFALGHYRNGVLLALATAERLADVITGLAPVTLLQPFSPDRFAQSEVRHG